MTDQQLRVRLTATDDGLKATIDGAVKDFGRFEDAGASVRKGMDSLQSTLNVVKGSIAFFVAREGYQFWKSSIDNAAALADMSNNLGLNVERMQEYQYSARLSGMSNQEFASSLKLLQRNAAEAAEGNAGMAESFMRLGVSVTDNNGRLRTTENLLAMTADGMARLNSPLLRTQAAMDVFGRSGDKMVSMLANGSAGLEDLQKQAHETGSVLSASLVREADAAGDKLDIAASVIRTNLSKSFIELSPIMIGAVENFAELTRQARLFYEEVFKSEEAQTSQSIFAQMDKVQRERVQQLQLLNEAGNPAVKAALQEEVDALTNQLSQMGSMLKAAKTRESATNSVVIGPRIAANGDQWNKESMERWGETAEQFGKRMYDIARLAYPVATETAEEYGQAQAKVAEQWLKGQESAEEYGKRMHDLARIAYPMATETAEEYGERMAELTKQTLEAAKRGDEVAQIYEDTASSIRGSFRDTFRDVFDEGVTGFERFGDRILSTFKDVLADMATLKIVQPIIVPIVGSLGGVLGVSSGAQAQVLQQLGGAGGGAGSALPLLGSIGAGLGAFGGGVGAGLAGGFGAASTAASGAAFSTGAGALSATGAFVGAALPWVAGALALNAVTGGGLFGTKWKTKDEGLDLAIAGGDITGQAFEIEKRKKSLFRGTSTRTNFSDADAGLLTTLNATLDADTAQLLAGARGLGVGTAESILDGFASQTRLSLAGKSESEMQQAIQDWLDTTLGDMAKAILGDTRWRGLLRDASREMIESVFSIGSVLGADPVADSRRMMEIANRTYKQQLDEQRRSLLSLNAVYDGSVTLTQQLAAAAQSYYQTELAYLQQIASVRTDIGSQLGGSIESIRQSTMDPAELYAYLQNRSVALSQYLTGATDPSRIQEIVREINATSGQAYGLIPQAEREAYAQQFIDFLTNVETTANQRLDGAQNQVAILHRDMAQTVTSTMQAVSDRLETAARAQEAAAEALSKASTRLQMIAGSRDSRGYYDYGTT